MKRARIAYLHFGKFRFIITACNFVRRKAGTWRSLNTQSDNNNAEPQSALFRAPFQETEGKFDFYYSELFLLSNCRFIYYLSCLHSTSNHDIIRLGLGYVHFALVITDCPAPSLN